MTEPTFSDIITSIKGAERVNNTPERVEHESGSTLEIREQGCFVTELTLTYPQTREQVAVLYSEPDHTVPKLVASHIMSPVGPSEGPGGQHGYARWVPYRVIDRSQTPQGDKQVAMEAFRGDHPIGITKDFTLYDDILTMATTIENHGDTDVQTSLGEHLYFNFTEGSERDIRVNRRTLDELLGEGAQASIMAGDAVHWADFEGAAVIHFPAGHAIGLEAGLASGDNSQLGMLIWHKPGTDSICFEPTVGIGSLTDNHELTLPAGGSVTLTTMIELLQQ